MNSPMVRVPIWRSASPPGSRPGGALERIEVRDSFRLTIKSPNPHPTLSALRPVAIPGEANVAQII